MMTKVKRDPELTQIGVRIGGGTKARMLSQMEASGRSLSNQAVYLIWLAVVYEEWLAAPNKTFAGLQRTIAELDRCKTRADFEQWAS